MSRCGVWDWNVVTGQVYYSWRVTRRSSGHTPAVYLCAFSQRAVRRCAPITLSVRLQGRHRKEMGPIRERRKHKVEGLETR